MRLRNITKTHKSFDNSTPKTPIFMKNNLKRQVMEQINEMRVDHENQLLLGKIVTIQNQGTRYNPVKIMETLPNSHGTLNLPYRVRVEEDILHGN